MGAHTLGRAHADASGYRGPWLARNAMSFNHEFYILLKNDQTYWQKSVRTIVLMRYISQGPLTK